MADNRGLDVALAEETAQADTSPPRVDDFLTAPSEAERKEDETKPSGGPSPGLSQFLTAPPEQEGRDKLTTAGDSPVGEPMYTAFLTAPTKKLDEPTTGWNDGIKHVAREFKQGVVVINRSVAGLQWATSDMSFDDAQRQVETDDYIQAQTEENDYYNTHAYWKINDIPFDPPGFIAEQIPSFGVAMAGGVIGAGVGSLARSPGLGFQIGQAMTFGLIQGGSTTYELAQRGVSKDQARLGGFAAGVGAIALSFAGLGQLVKGTRAAAAAATAATNSDAVLHTVMTVAKSMGIQTTIQEAQSMLGSAIKYITARTDLGAQPYTQQDVMNDFTQSAVQALVTVPALVAVTHGTGALTGSVAKRIQGEIDARTAEVNQQRAANAIREQEGLKPNLHLRSYVEAAKIKATKTLQGFVQVNTTPSIEAAQQALDTAKEAHTNAPDQAAKARAQLDVDHSEAQLTHAQHQSHMDAIEETLTNPDLGKYAKDKLAILEEQRRSANKSIDQANQEAENALTDEESEKWQSQAAEHSKELQRLQKEIRTAKAQSALSGDELRSKLEGQKTMLQGKVDEHYLKASEAKLKTDMAHREHAIHKLKIEIREKKQAARDTVTREFPDQEKSETNLVLTPEQKTTLAGQVKEWSDKQLSDAVAHTSLDSDQRLAAYDELDARVSRTTKGSARNKKLAGIISALPKPEVVEAPGAETAALRAKLENWKAAQAYDQVTKQLFEEKLITPEDAQRVLSNVPTKKLEGFIEVAKRQVDTAAKSGAADQRKASTAIRKLLDQVVDTSRLPQADKTSLKVRLGKLQKLEELKTELPKLQEDIQTLFEKRRHQAAVVDLEKALDTINPKKSQPSKTPGAEEALVAIKEFSRDPEAVRRFELNLEEKETLTPQDEQKLELASLFPDEIKNLSPEAIEKIIHTIVELKETGKAEALKRFQEKEARQVDNEAKFWKAATIKPSGKQVPREEVSSQLTKTMQQNPLKAIYRSWEGLMYLITQKGTLSPLRDIFDLKVANAKAWGMNHEWRERFKSLVNEHGVTNKEYAKALNRGEKKVPLTYAMVNAENDEVKFVPLKDPSTGEDYSRMQLVQVRNYLKDSDPDAISRLSQGNRFSYPKTVPAGTSTLEVIENYLNRSAPELLKIGDAMRQFYKEFGSVVDDTAYRRWGRHIEPNDTYGGPLHTGASLDSLTRESFRRMTVRPKSILERQGGSKRVEIRNAMDVLDQHIAAFSREHAFIQFEQDAQALFGDQGVRDFVTGNYGKTTMGVLDKYIKDIISGPRDVENVISRAVSFFRSKAFTFYLGGRPDQYIKQLTGAVHAFQINSVPEVIEGWSYFFANPKEAIEMMNKSPLLKNRKQLIDPDYKPAKAGDLNHLSQMFMRGVEAGDVAAVYLSSFPALLAELKKTGSQEKAIAAFDRAFETTQGSHGIDEQPHLFRSGSLMKMLSIFTQQANRQTEMISVEWDKFINDPSPKTYGEFANTVIVSYAGATLYPLAGWLVLAPFMDQAKANERLEEILAVAPLGPYASLPVWGLLLTPLMGVTVNHTFGTELHVHEPKALDTDILTDFLKNAEALIAAGDGDTEHVWKAIMASASVIGRLTGLPLPNLLKPVSPFIAPKK